MPEQDDGLPSSGPSNLSVAQAAAVATRQQAGIQAAARKEAAEDALDIKDPSITEPKEPTPETPAKPKTEKPATIPGASTEQFSPALLGRASHYGMSETEAKAYGAPEHLERTLSHLDRQAAQAWQQRQAQPAPQPAAQPAPAEPEFLLPDLLPPSDGEWDANLVGTWKNAQNAFQQLADQNRQLQESLQTIVQAQQSRVIGERLQQIDKFFNGLEGDLKGVYGTGTVKTIQPGSPQWQARKQMDGLVNFFVENHGVAFDQACEMAVNALHPGQAKKQAATEVEQRVRDHQGRFAAPPTSRRDSADSSRTDGDNPPDDPRLREKWAFERFAKKHAALGLSYGSE